MLFGIFLIVQLLLVTLKYAEILTCAWLTVFLPSLLFLVGYLLVRVSEKYRF